MKGKFIVIDGSDGAGKKTQSDFLIAKLKDMGREIGYYDFPQYDKSIFGQMVGRYLNGEFGEADEVSPYLSSMLYAGDRWSASQDMKADLDAGKIIISNRYTQSNMAFQGAKISDPAQKKKFMEWLKKLEFEVYSIPKPDLVIYLYMPYKISQALVDKKDERNYTKMKRDIHEKNADFLQRVENQYLQLSKENAEWEIIECIKDSKLMSIEEIGGKVFQKVAQKINIENQESSIEQGIEQILQNLSPMEELAS